MTSWINDLLNKKRIIKKIIKKIYEIKKNLLKKFI